MTPCVKQNLTDVFARASFSGISSGVSRPDWCVRHPERPAKRQSLKHKFHRAHVKSVLAALVLLVCSASVFAQQPEADKKPAEKDAKTQNAKPGVKPPFTLTVKTRPILNISLKAEK